MTQYATDLSRTRTRRSARAIAVLSLGPLAVAGGIVWALVQPWRVTLLHPFGQGFWWLIAEPPLLVILAGLVFHAVVARPLVDVGREAPEQGRARGHLDDAVEAEADERDAARHEAEDDRDEPLEAVVQNCHVFEPLAAAHGRGSCAAAELNDFTRHTRIPPGSVRYLPVLARYSV